MAEMTTIPLSKATVQRLKKLGMKGQTYEEIEKHKERIRNLWKDDPKKAEEEIERDKEMIRHRWKDDPEKAEQEIARMEIDPGIDLGKSVGLSFGAIRQLSTTNEELRKRIEELEKKVEETQR